MSWRPLKSPIFKVCANPLCKRPFQTYDTRRLYCNDRCQNRHQMNVRRKRDPEKVAAYYKTSAKRTYNRYHRLCDHAKRVGLKVSLTLAEYVVLVEQPCMWCGDELTGRGYEIDRLFNNHGYTKENSNPCCKRCNLAKGQMTPAEFIEMVTKIYLRFSSNPI
jgi:hypothetical protein